MSEPTETEQSAPVADETAPVAAPEDDGQVLLSLDAPWYLQSYTVESTDGSKLVIDKNGVRVDAPAANAILQNAAVSGVTLKIGN